MFITENLVYNICWATFALNRLHEDFLLQGSSYWSSTASCEQSGLIMPALTSLFKYWLFASAFATIYIILDAILESYISFKALYGSWTDCIILSGYGRDVAPVARSIVVLILALLFLRVQMTGSLVTASVLAM